MQNSRNGIKKICKRNTKETQINLNLKKINRLSKKKLLQILVVLHHQVITQYELK